MNEKGTCNKCKCELLTIMFRISLFVAELGIISRYAAILITGFTVKTGNVRPFAA